LLRLHKQEVTGRFVLMTAAHNEENFIEGAIQSVLAQTVRPERWVIVNDNSNDRTGDIVDAYARQHDFIHAQHISRPPGRDFRSKVLALQKAGKLIEDVKYDFIGNLDADVSLESGYFEGLLREFGRRPQLGICGGFVHEPSKRGYRSLQLNDIRNVWHAAQLVRRECYDAIGGYPILKYGGEDWYAQTKARMIGWQVEAVPKLSILHHRPTAGSSSLRNAFRLGRLDYSFGSDPVFEVIKCLRRLGEKPILASSFARLLGFVWPCICREQKAVPEDLAAFLRREQKERLRLMFSRRESPKTANYPA